MQEFRCNKCGYRQRENDPFDMMMNMPTFGSFGIGNTPWVSSAMTWKETSRCPSCGNATSWQPVIAEEE